MGLIFCHESLLDIDLDIDRVMRVHADPPLLIEAATLLSRLLRPVDGDGHTYRYQPKYRRDRYTTCQPRPARQATECHVSRSRHDSLTLPMSECMQSLILRRAVERVTSAIRKLPLDKLSISLHSRDSCHPLYTH